MTKIFIKIGFLLLLFQFTNCQVNTDVMSNNKKSKNQMNKLKDELSPYLLQHADNTVNWYPWGDEAFKLARELNRPIFLSIGYSTCHWCHVMEHESFEDTEVAKLLNDNFVSIKVDREERPEIDHLYMSVCQAMTGHGGWPLTIIMTPDKKPFFTGTYFPKNNRGSMPGMMQILPALSKAWQTDQDKIGQTVADIEEYLQKESSSSIGGIIKNNILEESFKQYEQSFDKINGGFRGAPKFPSAHNLIFLMRYYHVTKDASALNMVEKTLSKMYKGGIFDQIGFGFHRYSTDTKWLVPHFEKMLYDQAMLALAYIEFYQITKQQEFADAAHHIFEYVLRDMTHPNGGFYSAEDADSEGVEGKYYVWSMAEIHNVLGDKDSQIFNHIFNMTDEGNFTLEIEDSNVKLNIPNLTKPINELVGELNRSESELQEFIESSKSKLLKQREKRVKPSKDDKIITDWNGLMIAAFAKGAQVFQSEEFQNAAKRAVQFVNDNLKTKSNRLMKRYRNGKSGLDAHIDDYTFYIWGLLELYEATFKSEYLSEAIQLTEIMIKEYWDENNGGFFIGSNDSEQLIVRTKTAYDGAIPSGNSIAALILQKLGKITGKTEWLDMSEKIFNVFANDINRAPNGFGAMLSAYIFANYDSKEIVVVGNCNDPKTLKILNDIQLAYSPNKIIIFKDLKDKSNKLSKIAKWTKDYLSIEDNPTIYICKNYSCNLPTTDTQTAIKQLQE